MASEQFDVLIDTNIFIEREKPFAISEPLQELENKLNTQGHNIKVHQLSIQEVRNYGDDEGRKRGESKIATYSKLDFPPTPTSRNTNFRSRVPEGSDFNEQVDNALLFSAYKDRVDYLITEDKGIHKKADKLGIDDRVLTIEEGCQVFEYDELPPEGPPSIKRVAVSAIDPGDEIFDSLREEYPEFNEWLGDIDDNAPAYVNWQPDGSLGAVLILKPGEAERLGVNPLLPKRERLKIRTFKVANDQRGSKLGELLVSKAIHEAVYHGLDEVYLTHYVEPEADYLVKLISEYGFTHRSSKEDGEAVFVKRLTPGLTDDPDPFETHRRFYPSFCDTEEVNKFLVPIQPNYHKRLFPTYEKRQPTLQDYSGEFISEGNAIKKAYLTNSNIRKIDQNDILLFYRSHDHMEITSIGVCEQVYYALEDPDEIHSLVDRRTAYAFGEIVDLASSPTTVILFKWHFDLENNLHYQELLSAEVLNGPPQSIQQIDEDSYQFIKQRGGIDERFTVN